MSNFSFSADKMYTFIKGVATGKNYTNTLKALEYAREKHKDQKRKSGLPYIVHPLTMACAAISANVDSDILLSAILLHDVVEDCNVPITDLPVTNEIKQVVQLVTFVVNGDKDESKRAYYNAILENEYAVLVKLLDRYHNVSTMAGTFTIEKVKSYIEETRIYVIPLLDKAKKKYPLLSNTLFGLKYQIIPMIDSIDLTIKAFEEVK